MTRQLNAPVLAGSRVNDSRLAKHGLFVILCPPGFVLETSFSQALIEAMMGLKGFFTHSMTGLSLLVARLDFALCPL